jgi:hypothetical protein
MTLFRDICKGTKGRMIARIAISAKIAKIENPYGSFAYGNSGNSGDPIYFFWLTGTTGLAAGRV